MLDLKLDYLIEQKKKTVLEDASLHHSRYIRIWQILKFPDGSNCHRRSWYPSINSWLVFIENLVSLSRWNDVYKYHVVPYSSVKDALSARNDGT